MAARAARVGANMTANNLRDRRVHWTGNFRRLSRSLVAACPFLLLLGAVASSAYLTGLWTGVHDEYPSSALRSATMAYHTLSDKFSGDMPLARRWADFPPNQLSQHRISRKIPVEDDSNFLFGGGPGQYLDYCPGTGCAAVILRRDGSLVHAYPFRPNELRNKRTLELPYEEFMYDDARDTGIIGLTPLPNGDLIAVFDLQGSVPYGGGVGRLDKDGHVLWYRRDYSDHWPALTENNEILTISHKIEVKDQGEPFGDRLRMRVTCPAGKLSDIIRVLGTDGSVKEEIPLLEALRASPYRSQILTSFNPVEQETDPCNLLHTNSVNPVSPEMAAKFKDVQSGDLLVSFRNLSAVAIVGRLDRKLKHFFRGSFLFQHSAETAPGGNILLFDNVGGRTSSRILLHDPSTGAERVIFPNADTPKDMQLFNLFGGNIDISPDGTRALVAFYNRSRGYEIRLSDGAVLTQFENVHDLHTMPQFANQPRQVRYFVQSGIYYVRPNLLTAAR